MYINFQDIVLSFKIPEYKWSSIEVDSFDMDHADLNLQAQIFLCKLLYLRIIFLS